MRIIFQAIYFYRAVFLLLTLFLFTGCASINYYRQSIQGQFEVLHKRKAIKDILAENDIPDKMRNKLVTVLQIRDFSSNELGLPDNNSYMTYTDLERDYVIWNIFANEEFSLEPVNWCYLIVGCLSYRGYFSRADAERHATQLQEQGYEIYLGGVSAYSTLGWFDDPVLNTMLQWSDIRVASVIFHELAHQQLYIKNDTEFNESYADAVSRIGVIKWLENKKNKKLLQQHLRSLKQEDEFTNLVTRYKSQLSHLYNSDKSEVIKRKLKKNLLQEMKNEYIVMSNTWQENPYKTWFLNGINNAKLASVVTYRKYVPAFLDIYQKLNNNLTRFYSFSKSLSQCKPMKRKEILQNRKIEFEC